MEKSTGYREMLRDRMPRMLDLALKWRKGKERWLDHVYENHIKVVSKDKRSICVKQCLGLKQKYDINDMYAYLPLKGISRKEITNFIYTCDPGELKKLLSMDFHDTINWNSLDEDQTNYWKITETWVQWFKTQYQFLENAYQISQKCGKDDFDIRVELITRYLSALLPKDNESEEDRKAKFAYLDKFVDFLMNSFKGRI